MKIEPKFADGAPVLFKNQDYFCHGIVAGSVRISCTQEGTAIYEYSIELDDGYALIDEDDLEFEITIDFHADIMALTEL